MSPCKEVLVVGLGVSGLSCAIRLAQAGFRVLAIGDQAPLDTTSVVAGAVWLPFRAGPPDRVRDWASATREELGRLAEDPASGVHWIDGLELSANPIEPPDWADIVPGFRAARSHELRAGRRAGFAFRVPYLDTEIYLPWLLQRLEQLGGRWQIARVADLEQALDDCPTVVNCTGLGAREFASDDSMVPIRGQLLRVERGREERFLIDEGNGERFAYVLPRSRDVILGGTADEGREDLQPVAEESAGILERCRELVPELAAARPLGERVGLRPGRPTVRLESERREGDRLVVHNYGHGGAGVTLSWGCADEVCSLLQGQGSARFGAVR